MLRIVNGSTGPAALSFGSFEKEEVEEIQIVTGVASGSESVVDNTSPVMNTFVTASVATVRGDRLNELKKAEQLNRNHFMQVNAIPGRLNMRLGRDHFLGSLMDYSLEALYTCLRFLELPAEVKNNRNTKAEVLKTLFELDFTRHQGLGVLKNSFLHPLCFDAMKYLGDSLQPHQIVWLIENVPEALFENYQLLTSLNDYSFISLKVYEMHLMKYKTSMAIDYLTIPAFIKTAQIDVLMMFLSSFFEPSRHWNILIENKNLDELLNVKIVMENPRNYPFLVGVLPLEFTVNGSGIVANIRSNGLTSLLLGSLLSYVQETNDIIQGHMTEIAETWADLHKNSHLEPQVNNADINEKFNERVGGALNNLLYLRDQREDINELIKEFEADKIPAHSAIVKLCPDWLKSLKILVQTPFNLMMRGSFSARCSLDFMTEIDSEDVRNVVKLPRLSRVNTPEQSGFLVSANPMQVFNPLIWSSLWRSVFFEDGEEWRQDPEIANFSKKEDIERYLKSKYAAIYRDSDVGINDLIGAWTMLSKILPETYSKGPRLIRFISSISVLAPPKGFELPKEKLTERTEFIKFVVEALKKDVRLVDKFAIEMIKFSLNDSEEVSLAVDKILANSDVSESAGPQGYKMSIEELEELCKKVNSKLSSSTCALPPQLFFCFLKLLETSFATLGQVLSEQQIKAIGRSEEINKFLARHGRALTKSQVKGLLESEIGRQFLKSNQPMLRSLLDYSDFKPRDFEEFGISIDLIRLNSASATTSVKLLSLAKKGFSSVDDPLALVYSLGFSMWTDTSLFKSFALWELFNPIILAYDPVMTADGAFFYHITGIKHKLHGKVLLDLALVFVTKWLIAQDWYVFVYHVAISKGVEVFGVNMIKRLEEVYPKYLNEGELAGRKDLAEWLKTVDEGRCGKSDSGDITFELNYLSVAIDIVPLTPFREIANQNRSTVSELLAKPFSCSKHSPSLLENVKSLIKNRFKPVDQTIWTARLEILSQFSVETGKLMNEPGSAASTRHRLKTLSKFDAVIYKWALELEGVCVESIFRDATFDNLQLSSNSAGVIKRPVVEKVIETKKTETKKNKSKKKK